MSAAEPLVRPARPEDCPAILGLIEQLGYDVDAKRFTPLLRVLMNREAHAMLVAATESGVAGFANIHFRVFLRYGDLVATLDELCVDCRLRGQGIGAALIEATIAVCRQRGAHHLELTTNVARVEALRFYERLGFEVTSHKLVFELAATDEGEKVGEECTYARR